MPLALRRVPDTWHLVPCRWYTLVDFLVNLG